MTLIISATVHHAISSLAEREAQPDPPLPPLSRSRTADALARAATTWAHAVEGLRTTHGGHVAEVTAFIDAAHALDAELARPLEDAAR